MPHKVFNLGALTSSTEAQPNSLVPGVEPGGSRGGEETKPALLIRNVYLEPIVITGVTAGANKMNYYLKLSQEADMTPGLQLPIGWIQVNADGVDVNSLHVEQLGHLLAGSIWAPRFVGVRAEESGSVTFNVDIHLDYERVDVPWMDWFIMWDFLDNVVDNEREY